MSEGGITFVKYLKLPAEESLWITLGYLRLFTPRDRVRSDSISGECYQSSGHELSPCFGSF